MSCPHTNSMHRADHEHTRGYLKHTWATCIGMHVYIRTYVRTCNVAVNTWSPRYRATHACIGKQQQFQTTCSTHIHIHFGPWIFGRPSNVTLSSFILPMLTCTHIYCAAYASADTHAHIRIIRDHVCVQKPLYSKNVADDMTCLFWSDWA